MLFRSDKEEEVQYRLPFGGGSGAGISINPVAFVIVQKDSIKVLPIEHNSAIEKLMDYVPDLMEKADSIMDKTLDNQDKPKDKEQKNSVTKKGKLIKKIKSKPVEIVEEEFEDDETFGGEL